MSILEAINQFSHRYGRAIEVDGMPWRYYRLGAGSPVFWLTGGLRRAAFGYDFLQRLAEKHTVIAPDYPAVQTIIETSIPSIATNANRFESRIAGKTPPSLRTSLPIWNTISKAPTLHEYRSKNDYFIRDS